MYSTYVIDSNKQFLISDFYCTCDYLYMLGFKLTHVSKKDPGVRPLNQFPKDFSYANHVIVIRIGEKGV